MTVTPLQRAIGRAVTRRTQDVERCGLCAAPVAAKHRHVLDGQDGPLLCACSACVLLFDQDAAGGGRYRLVPTGRIRLANASVDALNVPVGLAFFVKQDDGRVLAHYPSPLGTTETEIDLQAWRGVERGSPPLLAMRPRVEALLVRSSTVRGREEQWILPVDDCFRLVAVIREHWTGMAGGSVLWREVARFFAEFDGRPGQGTGTE